MSNVKIESVAKNGKLTTPIFTKIFCNRGDLDGLLFLAVLWKDINVQVMAIA